VFVPPVAFEVNVSVVDCCEKLNAVGVKVTVTICWLFGATSNVVGETVNIGFELVMPPTVRVPLPELLSVIF
jgi:hypothetical protein